MKKLLIAGFFLTIAGFTTLEEASAEGGGPLSYNYIEGGYERVFFRGITEGIIDDANGFYLSGMLNPIEPLLLMADFSFADPSVLGAANIDFYSGRVGGGFRFPLGETVDFYTVGGALYVKNSIDVVDLSFSDWGFFVEPGIRVALTPSFELFLAGNYDYIDGSNEFGGRVGGIFFVTPNFGLEVVGSATTLDSMAVGVGARIAW